MRDNRPPWPRPGPGPEFLDAPGQPIGMVAAVISNGTAGNAGVLGPGGVRAAVPPSALAQLAQNDGLRHPVTRNLDGLGRYRVIAVRSRLTGETLVIGLSMDNVDATLLRVALIFAVVTAVGAGRGHDRGHRDQSPCAGAVDPGGGDRGGGGESAAGPR